MTLQRTEIPAEVKEVKEATSPDGKKQRGSGRGVKARAIGDSIATPVATAAPNVGLGFTAAPDAVGGGAELANVLEPFSTLHTHTHSDPLHSQMTHQHIRRYACVKRDLVQR